jgi:hypothetical protein
VHIHVRMGGACSRVRSDPGWPYQHSRAWNARGSRYTCHVGPPAQSRRGMPSVPPSSAVRHVPARPRAPVHRRAPQRACRRYIKHGTQVPGVPYPNPSITNIHGVRDVPGFRDSRRRMPNSTHGWVDHCKPPRRARLASLLLFISAIRGVALLLGIGSCDKHTPPFFSGTRLHLR